MLNDLFGIFSEKNLNSPDSNDSGIQADALSFQHLLGDLDLYGVVEKPKRKMMTNTAEGHYQLEESVERSKELLGLTSTKSDDIKFVKANKLDEDPYSMVESDSPDEASIEPTYAMIQTENMVLRINEQVGKFLSSLKFFLLICQWTIAGHCQSGWFISFICVYDY